MKKHLFILLISIIGFYECIGQTNTRITVRVKAKDAKYIGTSMGGARIVIEDKQTGRILSEGITEGSTGNTTLIMKEPIRRGVPIYDESSSSFRTSIAIDSPTLLKITATGPLAQPQSQISSSTEMWLIPGKHLDKDGILLELSGFVVDINSPAAHGSIGLGDSILIEANVVMMCGCTLTDGGIWNANKMEIEAMLYLNNEYLSTISMHFIKNNTFRSTYTPTISGVYQIIVTAFDPQTNNTGLDKTTQIVRSDN